MTRRFALIAALLLACASRAWAFEPFTVRNFRAEGLQRLDIGTVLTYLPLAQGDTVDERTTEQAIRALYESGLFDDVELSRDGDTLVIKVKERPVISSFKIEGNKKIGGDELKDSLKKIGLVEGELYKRAVLDGVEQELRRQYYANGFYDVEINSHVTDEPNNHVAIKIDVVEGKITRIRKINIIGNRIFGESELLDQLKLQKTNWMPFQRSDRYSKQQLLGDLESLQSYYQDRGYLKFNVSSVQVQLSPDKSAIYITINVEEGELYKVKDFRFSGETVLNEQFLHALTTTHPGELFSRKEATGTSDRIEAALSDVGFAFAKVTPLPEVDEAHKEVTINYAIEPGKRAYVRHIEFSGYGSTNDETLRREMRQLEAAPFSKSAVERSRVRLQRLPFVESAEVDTQPVPGTDDQVDVSFTIKERPPGSIQFGVGFSGAQGLLLNGSVTHTNFLGTGNRVQLAVDNSQISRQVSFAWTNPYFTEDGVSQTIAASYRNTDQIVRFASGFNLNTISANLTYGIPLSEFANLRAGLGFEDSSVDTFPNTSSDEVLKFARDSGTQFFLYKLRTGIGRDTRNRVIFANRGTQQQLNLDVTVPGSDLKFYTLSFLTEENIPLFYKFFINFNTDVGLVGTYGNTKGVPPYQNFFGGGPGTVRGFTEGTLGPRDSFGNPFGGRLLTTAQTELVIPTPFDPGGQTSRLGLFFDVGNVFAKPDDFDPTDLRESVGIAGSYFTPFLGILSLSYAIPLNDKPGDRTKSFQINFGQGF